jgi:hypothetical protein
MGMPVEVMSIASSDADWNTGRQTEAVSGNFKEGFWVRLAG